MNLVDQLLRILLIVIAGMVIVSLVLRRARFTRRGRQAEPVRAMTRDTVTDPYQVVAGLLTWLAVRLLAVWLLLLLVRLAAR